MLDLWMLCYLCTNHDLPLVLNLKRCPLSSNCPAAKHHRQLSSSSSNMSNRAVAAPKLGMFHQYKPNHPDWRYGFWFPLLTPSATTGGCHCYISKLRNRPWHQSSVSKRWLPFLFSDRQSGFAGSFLFNSADPRRPRWAILLHATHCARQFILKEL